MVNLKNNTEVWRARREFFSDDFPAATLVEVRSLVARKHWSRSKRSRI
jgi:2-iminobutanoate/2-iminopropanoate deaminase